MKLRNALLAAAISLSAGQAQAATITFEGPWGTIFPGNPTSEGIFTYDALSGQLFRMTDPAYPGNPLPHIEARIGAGTSVLTVFRNDLPGGLFTFDALDVAQDAFGEARDIVVTGLLGGVVLASDILTTSSTNFLYTTLSSSNLSGLLIDELWIAVDAVGNNTENFDNLVLTPAAAPVPEPSTLSMGVTGVLGLLGCGWLRRRRVGAAATLPDTSTQR